MPLNEQEELELLRLKKQKAMSGPDKGPDWKEKAYGAAYGAATGYLGGPGELEHFAVYDVPEYLGFREKGDPKYDRGFGRETFLPTTKEIGKVGEKLGIPKPREDVSGWQTAGEIASAAPSLLRAGAKKLLGMPTRTGEEIAKKAESLGFKLSPAQVRADVPVPSKGATFNVEHNQKLANELASEGTGVKAPEISKEFIAGRIDDIGKEFDKVYSGKKFNIDEGAINALNNISYMESQLASPAAVSPVKQIADDILTSYKSLMRGEGAKASTFAIDGEALQRLRNALSQRARSGSRSDAHVIYDMIDQIDDSIARNHPEVAKKLSEIRPQYRNAVVLEDLYRGGGIRQGNISLEQLGNMLTKRRDAVRRNPSDIDNLADIGQQLKLRARWETAGHGALKGEDPLHQALGTGADIASALTLGHTRPARALQRYYAGKEPATDLAKAFQKQQAVSAAGQLTKPFQTGKEQ